MIPKKTPDKIMITASCSWLEDTVKPPTIKHSATRGPAKKRPSFQSWPLRFIYDLSNTTICLVA